MNIKMLFIIVVLSVMIFVSIATATDYTDWERIRECLLDGNGAEFVTWVSAPISGTTEWEQVKSAAEYVATFKYRQETTETWTAADQFPSITVDCEDYAIFLCAILRYVIGVPANRVWVSVNLIPGTSPEKPVVGHAWVGYKLPQGGTVHIEPIIGKIYRGAPRGALNFNDKWVKGGGQWLAGPR